MSNPVYTSIYQFIYDLSVNNLQVRFLNEPKLICLYTIQCFQVFLFIVCTQSNAAQSAGDVE